MKIVKSMLNAFQRGTNGQVRYHRVEGDQYLDNYYLLGSIMGGVCGMFRTDDRRR